MMLIRFSQSFRMLTQIQSIIPKLIKSNSITCQSFCSNKNNIDEQLNKLADTLPNVKEDYTEIANNYIQLQENSFIQYVKQHKNDPQMMLMLLSTFENNEKIKQFLLYLYPHIDFFESKELLLLLEKVLVFRPAQKPKIPFPKPLQGIESILVIMSQIYESDKLTQWLSLVPIYSGKEYYVLFMGYFSILEKMSPEVKNRNQSLLIKCHHKICEVLSDQSQKIQIRAGIISLGFQLNYGQAILLLLQKQLDYKSIDPYKICLLYTNACKYQINRIKKSQQIQEIETSKQNIRLNNMMEKELNKISQVVLSFDFAEVMKIELLLQIFQITKQKKQLKGQLNKIFNKCLNLIVHKSFVKSMKSLEIRQLLLIFQTIEKHKINNQRALKILLVLFSPHLYNMNKLELMTLTRCLVTYVRQCEDYLINVRKILEERKMQFTQKEAAKINETLRRVEVLFPRKFSIK